MAHSYRNHFFHLIWSTKNRKQWISSEIQTRLYSYVGGIIVNYEAKPIEIGGMQDHLHLLVQLNSCDKFSSFVRDIKTGSSLWIHKNFPALKDFAWQNGYGSFSVSYSVLEDVQQYIRNQEQHHTKMSFEDEFVKFLNLQKIKCESRFVLG